MSNTKSEIVVYTDGSCLKNPGGASGWAFAVVKKDVVWAVSGGDPSSTNNRMELQAVIEALEFWGKSCNYKIHSDSMLVIKCAKNEWKRKSNLDLWDKYDSLVSDKIVTWQWVKGHSGDEYNEIVDKLARDSANNIKNKIL